MPVDIAASVLVLQSLHGLSDREAMAAVRTDLRWKVRLTDRAWRIRSVDADVLA